ncbi:5694e39c-5271-435a-a649-dba11c1f462f [Thermothielavioides terrestris]|uniref:5694e39c-5271-435a-a649-dba11c1f462f n=1 Tax=Thermothielavioides terrestris TaxID=2587410 RepID=A0A3S4ASL6_9PEZI|nr:5694e39c-5271-435a-a649-dba11c1f462f [Thermothielavioides terrestris]
MTRTVVYGSALVAVVAATAMTLTAILSPRWVSYTVPAPAGGTVTDTIGLHHRCASSTGRCLPFPDEARCQAGGSEGRAFCSMWRSAGFLMNLAAVAELATVVGFLAVMAGGKVKRQGGWKVLGGMLGAVAAAELVGMAVVAYLFDHNELFLVPGYRLDSSWYLCMLSAAVALLAAAGLAISAFVLPPEDGYQLLSDPSGV